MGKMDKSQRPPSLKKSNFKNKPGEPQEINMLSKDVQIKLR